MILIFFAVAMQVAAHEAKLGHGKLAQDLRSIIDEAKARKHTAGFQKKTIPITQPRGELSNLLRGCVYLFDEFDSIGSKRALGNDVGEIRRVLNSILQLIQQDDSDSIIDPVYCL